MTSVADTFQKFLEDNFQIPSESMSTIMVEFRRLMSEVQNQVGSVTAPVAVRKGRGAPKKSTDETKTKSTRGCSGYNLFVKEKMGSLEGETGKSKLKSIGGLWHSLSDDDKKVYNDRAKQQNSSEPCSQEAQTKGESNEENVATSSLQVQE
jgi:hypothetical protein